MVCFLLGVSYRHGDDTIRLGFSRVSMEDIEKGIRIIGEEAEKVT